MNNLNELGLVEMRQEEMVEVDGGAWLADWIASAICACNRPTVSQRWVSRNN